MARTPEGIGAYYAHRAHEYERIYSRPERQDDLRRLRQLIVDFGAGRRLLEIACGTGYWTEAVARMAEKVVATDAVEEVLAIARGRDLPWERVSFVRADAFALAEVAGEFDAAFAGFWWSHVSRTRLAEFLGGLHGRLGAGRILFFDNRFVAGSSTALSRRDDVGNTYQWRLLKDGTRWEVVKNFPSAAELRMQIRAAGGAEVEVGELQYYWWARYEVRNDAGAGFPVRPDRR